MRTKTIIEYERGDEVEIVASADDGNLGITGIVIEGCEFEKGCKTSKIAVSWSRPVHCKEEEFSMLTSIEVARVRLRQ